MHLGVTGRVRKPGVIGRTLPLVLRHQFPPAFSVSFPLVSAMTHRALSARRLEETFPGNTYIDVPGLCKIATPDEAQGWSLNPGRYVGVAERIIADFDFKVKLEALNEELETLNIEAHELEGRISENINKLLDEMGD